MPTLRTVATIWIGFVVGTVTAVAFLALTPPPVSQLLDGLLTVVAFAVGGCVAIALVRFAHSKPSETAREVGAVRKTLLPVG